MKKLILLLLASSSLFFISSCTLEDSAHSSAAGTVYTCDAHTGIAAECIEEPIDPNVQKVSKSTCASVGGTWSDQSVCPSGYGKQCPDGNKQEYFYAQGDGNKACGELVGTLFTGNGPISAYRR